MAAGGSTGLRVCAIADQHGFLPEIPACDILLVAGDVCPVDDHRPDRQHHWLQGQFRQWLDDVPANAIVGIAGNHDFVEDDDDLMRSLPWTYLRDETAEIDGLVVHGSPWTPTFGSWAFMRPDQELADHWATIPDDVELLLTHGPPRGFGDRTRSGEAAGSETLARRVPELPNLRLGVFGHIHEEGGYRTQLGQAILANVAYVDESYRPAGRPPVFEL